jgi:hypothetical protein
LGESLKVYAKMGRTKSKYEKIASHKPDPSLTHAQKVISVTPRLRENPEISFHPMFMSVVLR